MYNFIVYSFRWDFEFFYRKNAQWKIDDLKANLGWVWHATVRKCGCSFLPAFSDGHRLSKCTGAALSGHGDCRDTAHVSTCIQVPFFSPHFWFCRVDSQLYKMEIYSWKTDVLLVSVPTSILLVHLEDIMWPIEGKLAHSHISKAAFFFFFFATNWPRLLSCHSSHPIRLEDGAVLQQNWPEKARWCCFGTLHGQGAKNDPGWVTF